MSLYDTYLRLKQARAKPRKSEERLQDIRSIIARHQWLHALPYWVSAVAVGSAAVGYTLSFKGVTATSARLFGEHPWAFCLLSPATFIGAWWLVHHFAPQAGGSGIPQVLASLKLQPESDHPKLVRLLSLRTTAIKVLSSLLCLFGGGAIGREGPTIQIAASIFFVFGTRFQRYWPKTSHHTWIVAGGGAGLAAAFNTPLGGLVYAIEELATSHFAHFRTALISAVIISGLVAQWLLGPYLYLGYPAIEPVSFATLVPALLVGASTGLLGAIFGRILFGVVRLRARLQSPWQFALAAGVLGLAMAALAIVFGTNVMGSGTELIGDLLSTPPRHSSLGLAVLRALGNLFSYASGAAGGIFAPSLSVGAALGSQLSQWFWPESHNLLVLLGMIGFLCGVTRTPFTSFVLVLEMTDHHTIIFPMMLSSLAAHSAAHLIDHESFYERMRERFLAI